MFDNIGVSERTRKPWTVAVSFAGQGVMIGLAILVPLVTTEALPYGRLVELLTTPEPPPRPPRPRQPEPAVPTKRAPSQFNQSTLRQPAVIPTKVAVIEDPPDFASPASSQGEGVPGSIGPATGTGGSPFGTHISPPPEPQPASYKQEPKPKPIPRITVGGVVQQGKLISGPSPVYPTLAKQARISGVVRLQAVIARNGNIMDLHAVSGHPLLIPAAVAAVRQWIFQPTYLNGEPVEVATDIEVKFMLQ